MSISNTALPDDFIEKVLRHTDVRQPTLRDAVDEAILAVLPEVAGSDLRADIPRHQTSDYLCRFVYLMDVLKTYP
jgi:hypothetical protein